VGLTNDYAAICGSVHCSLLMISPSSRWSESEIIPKGTEEFLHGSGMGICDHGYTTRAAKGRAQGYCDRHGARPTCNASRNDITASLMSPPRSVSVGSLEACL